MNLKKFLKQDVSWRKIKLKLVELDQKYSITQKGEQFSRNHFVALRLFLVFLFAFIVFWQSWTTDDAYHSYIMARHLAEGKGLVYNVGYRVTASTCPLLTLIQAGVYSLLHNMVASGVLIGVLCSGGAAAVLFFKFCTKFRYAVFAFLAMILSYSFMSFTTSGLENSLLFLLGSLFLSQFFSKDFFNAKNLFVMAFILALLAIARMDTVLIFIPMIVIAYLFMTKVNFIKRIGVGLLGLSPFILWEAFALLYYGFPFPNTFYAKLYSDYSHFEYIEKGLTYLHVSFLFDCLLIIIPILFLVLTIIYRSKKCALLFTGIVLYVAYIIWIGGDFMVGRHLTLNYFLAICGTSALLSNIQFVTGKNIKTGKIACIRPNRLAICSLCLAAIFSPFLKPFATDTFSASWHPVFGTGIEDEKLCYCKGGAATIDKINHKPDGMRSLTNHTFRKIQYSIHRGDKGFLGLKNTYPIRHNMIYGYIAYSMADITDIYLTDFSGLMDPLLSRVPNVDCKYWRIGHIVRKIPSGYAESVRTGENLIVDPSLHTYYDKMLIIITGDLFNTERLKTIWNMNTGKYDYLLNNYRKTVKQNPTEYICE